MKIEFNAQACIILLTPSAKLNWHEDRGYPTCDSIHQKNDNYLKGKKRLFDVLGWGFTNIINRDNILSFKLRLAKNIHDEHKIE